MPKATDEKITISKDLADQMLMVAETYVSIMEDILERPQDILVVKQIVADARSAGIVGLKE